MSLTNVLLTEDDHISVMASYFAEKGPAYHQFDSYQHLVDKMLQEIIDETPSIYIKTKTTQYKATFGQVYLERACFIDENRVAKFIYPQEARLRDLTYESPVFVDIIEEFWELNERDQFEKVNTIDNRKNLLMKIPVMVRSSLCNLHRLSMDECIQKGECSNDPGGYFIINGKERVLVCQERLNYNQVYVFGGHDDKNPHVAEIRSMSRETGHSVLVQAKMNHDGKNICFSLPYMSKDIAAGAVFKALNMDSSDILRFIQPSTKEEAVFVDRLIRESIQYTNKRKAIQYISKASLHKVEDDEERCITYTEQVIENELFPHMGISTPTEKCILLGDMLNKLFRVFLKTRLEDDRDNVSLKRIEGPGVLIGDLFRMSMKRYCDNLKKYLEKRQDIITAMNRTNSITAVLKHTFSTGNWAAQKNTYVRTGVSQVINHLTYPGTISHLRRVVIPVGKEGKNVKIRQIHPSQAFFIDIIESPEGKSIGIVKNLALLCNITTGVNSILIRDLIEKCENMVSCEKYMEHHDWWRIYLNGTLIGISQCPEELYGELKEFRDMNIFSNQVSFYMDEDDREIRVFCDPGRYIRPVLTVQPGNILTLTKKNITEKMSWSDMLDQDIVRYIDSNEVENSLIAMTPDDLIKHSNHDYDYCEIHPSAMLGVCSAVIPYPEHNQSPRLVYQASMVKQALGVYSLAFQQRFDTVTHVMHYPQKPMVSTKFDEMLKYDEMLTGCNPIVAIATYGGWNQEDSVMLNRSAVDRGMFVHTCYKTLVVEEHKKTNNSFEKIEVPPPSTQNKTMNYSKLGPNGIAKKGVPVQKGDIIIGKTLTKVQKDEDDKTDCSLAVGNGEEGIVDEIWEGLNEDGYKMVKVRIRQLRVPEVGDKFASRSSQKGVCGLMLTQEDMPFTESGMTPDIIINPHCFTAENQVSLFNGLSRKIGDLRQGEGIWTYDNTKKGLTCRPNMGMEWKGFRKVVKLTFQDGRTIRCTPDHKFFTTDQRWVEAKDLNFEHDRIVMGLDGVEDVNYGDEKGWKLETENFTFSCETNEGRERAMAFARILGHILTDGCVHQSKRNLAEFSCPINFGHSIDAEICVQDIELITGKTPKICTSGENGMASTYVVYPPHELCRTIGMLDGITIGRKTRRDSDWPSFVKECPKSILREFLASMFGGDGHAPYLNRGKPVVIKFSKSIHETFKVSFEEKMKNLCNLLNQFDVEACIERIREFRNDRDELFYSYYINIKNSLKFAQVIGFRYCTEKMSRTCLYKSYMEFQERVKKQSERILSLVDHYSVDTPVHRALEKAREEFLKTEPALNEYYSLSSMNQIGNRRKKNRSTDVLHLSYKYFPTFTEYLTDLGCREWFSKTEYITTREKQVLPTFHMHPIRIDDVGEDDVYCIGVEEFHNFLCNGGAVLNCVPSRMTMSQMIEMLLGKTGAMAGKIGDSTAFTKSSINPVESIAKQLSEFGFERYGSERMMSGYTGEMMHAEIFIGTAYYQRLKHLVKDKMHCLTLDHEVLTLDGWKLISDITTDDRVATITQQNGELQYQRPTNVWRYSDYEGEMYHIKNQSIDISVTGKHRMWTSKLKGGRGNVKWTKYEFEEARDLVGKHRRYKKDANWTCEDYQFTLPSVDNKYETKTFTTKEMEDFLVFFGIWYAEGWASGKDTYGRVTISVNKERVRNALFPSLQKLGYHYIYEEKTQKLTVSNNQLYRYMKPLSVGAPQKKMPSWVLQLSKKQTQILLDSMILGDGFYVKSNPNRAGYYTSSKQLADQFQQLCLHAGWASNITIHYQANSNETYIKGRKIVNLHDILRLGIIKSKVNPSVNHGHVHKQSIQEERFVHEKCEVMCITVPNEVFYVRRNGKAVWTGNSRARGNVTMMHHQPSEGRSKDGGLRTGEMERDALIAHGGSAFIQETFFDMSDVYQVNVCDHCGGMVSAARECRTCRTGDIAKTNIPYCAKLLLQELQALGVSIKIKTV